MGLISLLIYGIVYAFEPEYETVVIEQKVGGQLICKSVYIADHHSWQYDIDYSYLAPNKDTIRIGSGSYYGREWEKNEQLERYGNWLILKTGGFQKVDKLLIGKVDSSKWMNFEISSEKIEKDSLWISQDIHSRMHWLPNQSSITRIDNGIVTVGYLYRTGETVEKQETRTITYKIDPSTGRPKMIDIELKDKNAN